VFRADHFHFIFKIGLFAMLEIGSARGAIGHHAPNTALFRLPFITSCDTLSASGGVEKVTSDLLVLATPFHFTLLWVLEIFTVVLWCCRGFRFFANHDLASVD